MGRLLRGAALLCFCELLPGSGSLPDLHGAILPASRNISAVWRPTHRVDSLWLPPEGSNRLPAGTIPDLDSVDILADSHAPGGNALAIGRPGQVPDDASIHLRWIVGIGQQHIAGGGIPDKYLALGWSILASAGRDNARAIGRPGQGVDGLRVLAEGEDWLAGQRVPDLHGGIVSRRGNPFAIGRPGQRSDWA